MRRHTSCSSKRYKASGLQADQVSRSCFSSNHTTAEHAVLCKGLSALVNIIGQFGTSYSTVTLWHLRVSVCASSTLLGFRVQGGLGFRVHPRPSHSIFGLPYDEAL